MSVVHITAVFALWFGFERTELYGNTKVMSYRILRKFGCLGIGLALLSSVASADDVVVRKFIKGSDQNAIGIVEATEDTEIGGPQALTIGDNGDLYLLDQVNNRIVAFDPKKPNVDPNVFRLPGAIQPTDLIVRKNDIMVWDGTIRTFKPSSAPLTSTRGSTDQELEEVSTRAGDDQFVTSAFAQMGSQTPGSAAELLDPNTRAAKIREPRPRSRQYVATRGTGSVVVDVIPEKGDTSAQIEVLRAEAMDQPPLAKLQLKVRDRLGAVEFLEIDNNGRLFVFGENIPRDASRAAAFVARYSPAGVLEGIYELPLANVPLSRRFVAVSGDGDVYFLRTEKDAVDVLGVGFRPMTKSKVIDIRPPAATAARLPSGKVPIAAVRPLTRQVVIENALAFEGFQWRLTQTAYGRDPDTVCTGFNGRIRRPTYLHNKLGQEVRGVPYCWGCHGSLPQFAAKLERGIMAGNICTHNNPRSDVIGVDCSAFVSAAWGLSTHYTTAAIPTIASRITDATDLRPGDAFNKPGSHVMLFMRFTPDRKVEVMEASPGACNGRVCRNIYPLASLLARGYAPVRFRTLANDTSTVAMAAPDKPEKKAKPAKHKKRR